MAKINIYYEELKYAVIEQVPAYTSSQLGGKHRVTHILVGQSICSMFLQKKKHTDTHLFSLKRKVIRLPC